MSLRLRLTLTVGAAVAASVALATAATLLLFGASVAVQRDQRLLPLLDSATSVMAAICPDWMDRQPPATPTPMPGGPSPRPLTGPDICPDAHPVDASHSKTFQQYVMKSGVTFVVPGQRASWPVDPASRRLLAAGSGPDLYQYLPIDGATYRVVTRPLGGGAGIQAAWPVDEAQDSIDTLRWVFTVVSVAGSVAALLIGALVAYRGLRPIRRLTALVEQATDSRDLGSRIPVSGNDEVARLARSVNMLLDAVERSERAQRQLVADASHELRTPLTSMRANVDFLARHAGMPADEREAVLADLVPQMVRLGGLVDDVLDLARGDVITQVNRDEVRLDSVVATCVAAARAHYPDVLFDLQAGFGLVVGDATRIRRAVNNLLDNAAKWSPPAATVEVAVAGGALSVRDHGPGIDPADLDHVFDRFWRAAGARSVPGSGLGLAIVRQIAESHGGDVQFESPRDGGSRFILRLPEAPPEPSAEAQEGTAARSATVRPADGGDRTE